MGFAAAPLLIALGVLLTAGVIFLLYWVRPEPQPVVVPSNLIWRRVLDERRRREDFLRWLISLLIALVAALAVVLAVARPLPGTGLRSGRVVIVMDTSPSMAAAVADGETRWDRAYGQARRILAAGNETSEFLLLDTAGQRGGRSFTDRRAAFEALDSLGPVHGAEHGFPRSLRSARSGIRRGARRRSGLHRGRGQGGRRPRGGRADLGVRAGAERRDHGVRCAAAAHRPGPFRGVHRGGSPRRRRERGRPGAAD